MLKVRKCICSIDFGMIGCDYLNNVMIELAFDRKYLVRPYPSKEKRVLVSKYTSQQSRVSFIGFSCFSRGQHYERFLKKIIKNTEPVDWQSIDISYLMKVYSLKKTNRTIQIACFRIDMIQSFNYVSMPVQ